MCVSGAEFLVFNLRGLLCFFKHKTAYEMRISEWRSDVCSSDLFHGTARTGDAAYAGRLSPSVRQAERSGGSRLVCHRRPATRPVQGDRGAAGRGTEELDRKSVAEGTRVSVRVDLGDRRSIKIQKQ